MAGGRVTNPGGAVSVAVRGAALAALLLFPRAVDGWQVVLAQALVGRSAWVSLLLVLALLVWVWSRVGGKLSRPGSRMAGWLILPYATSLYVLIASVEILLGPAGEGVVFLCAVAGGLSAAARGLMTYARIGDTMALFRPMGQVFFILALAVGFLWRAALSGNAGWYVMNLGKQSDLWLGASTTFAAGMLVVCEAFGARGGRGARRGAGGNAETLSPEEC